MKLINEAEIFETWAPLITEKTDIKDASKVEWLTKYCHYHSINEAATPYQTLDMIPGMGQPLAPTRTTTGSGDKFPSLLPLAIQVAAKTVGFDIVPVIPMQGPTGVLTYLDYVYAGGTISGATAPVLIKITPDSAATHTVGTSYTAAAGGNSIVLVFVGKSRIDGSLIFKTGATTPANTPISSIVGVGGATLTTDGSPVGITANTASLVSSPQDHIQGVQGAGGSNTDNFQGPFAQNNSLDGPMNRETGEVTYFNEMGLTTFTKWVEAKTYQMAASVTIEQIQDLQKQFGIDVVSMIENSLVNDISQAINKNILQSLFTLGALNATRFTATEGQNLDLDLNVLPTVGTYENLMTFQRRIFSRIVAAGSVVANRGRRGPANFIVCGPQVASAIQDISQFQAAPFANTVTQNTGALYPVGTVAGMTVYVDQNMKWTDCRVLLGRKGADDEPGLKFMPYLMAESFSTIAQGTMSPKVAVKSRYALVEAGFNPETMYFAFTITPPTAGLV